MKKSTNLNAVFYYLLIALFFVGTNYYKNNVGGEALALPFNSVTWIFISVIVALAIWQVIQRGYLVWSHMATALFAMMALVLLLPALLNIAAADTLALGFRLAAFSLIFSLFVAFQQFKLSQEQKKNILFYLLISASFQAIYGLLQLYFPEANTVLGFPSISNPEDIRPTGIFQQVNILASYLAVGLLVNLHLLTDEFYVKSPKWKRLLLLITLLLCAIVFMKTSSRTAFIGFLSGFLLLLLIKKGWLKKNKSYALLFFSAVVILLMTNSTSLNLMLGKLKNLTDKEEELWYSRSVTYQNSWELFLEKPLLGQGIGKFQVAYYPKKQEYIKQHPEKKLGNLHLPLNHPHNEVLLWVVEGGILSLAGVIVLFISIIYLAIKKDTNKRFMLYLALASPILLQTQVSLPFFLSVIHIVILIYLLAMWSQNWNRSLTIKLTENSQSTISVISLSLPLMVIVLMLHTLSSGEKVLKYRMLGFKHTFLLKSIADNPYWYRYAEFQQMTHLLIRAKRTKNKMKAKEYLQWVDERLKVERVKELYIGRKMALDILN